MLSGLQTNNSSYIKEREVFNHSRDFNEAPRKTGTNFRGTKRGFSYNKSNNKPFKDPDVWDPPSPRQMPDKRVSKNSNNSNNYNIRSRNNQPVKKRKSQDPNGKK